ncbi:LytR/AlgR family response regulator transcription factor [Maribacter sp. 2304DJ31-5]|uniref:LytR/AlgR family response regulator transcription factor n=1 Tax=Maribacter sp. 2304DJ31-5 TaxID=3386273 RepID=UPI0039BC2AA8
MKRTTTMFNQPVPFLNTAKNKLLLVACIAIYSLFFLSLYNPFNLDNWAKQYYHEFIFYGSMVLLLSQFVLRYAFNFKEFKVYSLLLWCLFEIALVSFGYYFMYSPIMETPGEKLYEYFDAYSKISLILIIPYIVFFWYFSFRHKLLAYKEIEHHTVGTSTNEGHKLMILKGENDKITMAIEYRQLLYVKSSGNYLDIYYLHGEKLSKELVRMSLKEMGTLIRDTDIIRIHRSYIINKKHISSFKRTRKGYMVNLNHITTDELPVSSSYKNSFEKALTLKTSH